MIKTLLGALTPWKYGLIAVAIAGLLSWHYGSVHFAKREGAQQQQQKTAKAVNILIDKQVTTNEKIKRDVDESNSDDLRAGLLKRARPDAYTPVQRTASADRLQSQCGGSDGRPNDKSGGDTPTSVQSTYQSLCRSAGCETACQSISFDGEFGIIGECEP